MAVAIQRNNIITNITVFNRQHGLITVHFVIFISQIVCKMLSSSIVVFFVSTTSFMSSVDIKRNSKILVFLLFFLLGIHFYSILPVDSLISLISVSFSMTSGQMEEDVLHYYL